MNKMDEYDKRMGINGFDWTTEKEIENMEIDDKDNLKEAAGENS